MLYRGKNLVEKNLLTWLKTRLLSYLVLISSCLIAELSTVFLYVYLGQIIQEITRQQSISIDIIELVRTEMTLLFVLLLMSAIAQFTFKHYAFKLSNEGLIDLESKHLDHLMHTKLEHSLHRDKIELAQQINNDCVCVMDFWIEQLPTLIIKIIKLIIILIIIKHHSLIAFLLVTTILILYSLLYRLSNKRYTVKRASMLDAQNDYFSVLGGELLNVFLVKANSWYKQSLHRFMEAGNRFVKRSVSFLDFDYFLNHILKVVGIFMMILIPLSLRISGQIRMEAFIVLTFLIQLAFPSIDDIFQCLKLLYAKNVATGRLSAVLSIPLDINGILVPETIDNIKVNKVTFKYTRSKENILTDYDVNLSKGKLTLLIGANGSGKSTLVKLILGLLTPNEGNIEINGIELDQLNMEYIRERHIAICEQDPYLVKGKILDNLNYSQDINQGAEYYQQFKLLSFVDDLPLGYDTVIDSQSKNISGGQKQRISLCRTLAKKNTDVLILDEPSSALDKNGIEELKELLHKVKKDKIVLVISHNTSLIESADIVHRLF